MLRSRRQWYQKLGACRVPQVAVFYKQTQRVYNKVGGQLSQPQASAFGACQSTRLPQYARRVA